MVRAPVLSLAAPQTIGLDTVQADGQRRAENNKTCTEYEKVGGYD